MNVAIREVKEEDAEAITELLNPIIRAGKYTVMDTELSVAEQLEFIRSFPERGVFKVAVCKEGGKEDDIVGLQDVVPLETGSEVVQAIGVISTFVALSSHGQGVGRSLSAATFSKAKELGFTKLSATIRADNPSAVAFYLSQGFKIIGTAQNHAFVQDKYVDEVFAEKLLA